MNLREYVRSTLDEFVRIPSTPESDMSPILSAARVAVEDLGLRPVVHPDVHALVASSGSGGVLVNGHLDTVPIGAGWTHAQGSWEGDFLYGRGTADMKAGCVAGLAAARTLLDESVPFSLLLTTDEETTMNGAIKLASSKEVRTAAAVVVAEPSAMRVITSEKGLLWYRATTRGRGAHGSMPHLGDNAIQRMARVVLQLERFGRPKDVLAEITISVGAIHGGTKANVVADACSVDLDCRYPPGMTKDEVEAVLRESFAKAKEEVSLELFHEVPAIAVPADAAHVRLLRDLAGTEVVGVAYGTEMAYYGAENPRCAVFGPGETERIHVPDERVALPEVVRAAEILIAYGTKMAATTKSSNKGRK
ncbi:MAG TPA: M20/M25/M40 family metallo-hydrolase [Thermoplasmata archaeon]|nr:M20/M25/M40 family metallo-hydrolase [Thermoplasmata archaeon]